MIGSQLGSYRVEEQIGKGGMGIVYRAVDTRLGRSVAIKVLPDQYSCDPERRRRFEQEARLLAALNHPHIAAIHGLDEYSGVCALVLEYVPGKTLEEHVRAGSITYTNALNICRQIAEALESAHAKGIVHRDLKPANVKITPDDTVKVLDFGLSKVFAHVPADCAPDLTTTASVITVEHRIVGTPAYMSPEQAQGKPVDRRTDIWAFGCLLYELLTRRRAFIGETASDQLAAVLAKDPDWTPLPHDVDPRIRLLLRRCLEKDPRKRLCDIGDARLELADVLSGGASEPGPVRRKALWPAIVTAFLAGGAVVALWFSSASPKLPPPVTRFVVPLPTGHRIVTSWNPTVLFTRDGSGVTYSSVLAGVWQSFERSFSELEIKPAIGGLKNFPISFFSPDGKWAAAVDQRTRQLNRLSVRGGAPTLLTNIDMFGRGDWGRDGFLYFTERYPGSIYRMREEGGRKEPVTTLDPQKQEFVHKHTQILPGGKAIIFTAVSYGMASYDDARIELLTLDTRKRKVLVQGGFSPRYAPSGHIVYARAGSLYAVPFNVRSLEITGPSAKVVDGVLMSTNNGSAYYDVSSTGALAYAAGNAEGGERTLVWVDRHGRAQPLPLPARSYLFPRISPDQRTVAFEIEGATHDLYTYDLDRGVMSKITMDGLSHAPVWTPDGKSICYRSWKAGTMTMWRMPADRSAPEVRLTNVGAWQSAVSVSPNGRYVTFNQMKENMRFAVYVLPVGESDKPQPVTNSQFSEASAKFSPDGKWLVYCSDESGRPEVFVQPWPGTGPKVQISSDGGFDPLWARKGNEIFYRSGDKTMVVPVSTAAGFRAGKPRLLWEGHYSPGMSSSCGPPGVSSGNYDITADGQRFLMVKDNDQDTFSTKLVVVSNWTRELR